MSALDAGNRDADGASASITANSGSLSQARPRNPSAANSTEAGRRRWGSSSLRPVPMIRPAAAAEIPRRMSCSTPISAYCRYTVPTAKPITQGIAMKPASAARAPDTPRSRVPIQTARLGPFGPGMNWHRPRISANSTSPSQRRCSTTMRRTHTIPPPNANSEACRNPANSAGSVTGAIARRGSTVSVMFFPDQIRDAFVSAPERPSRRNKRRGPRRDRATMRSKRRSEKRAWPKSSWEWRPRTPRC